MRTSRIVVFVLAAAALLALAFYGLNAIVLLMATSFEMLTGLDVTEAVSGWGGTLLLAALIVLFPRDLLAWNRKYCIEGEVVIDASIEEVWDWLHIREREDYFSTSTRRITAIPGKHDEFRMLFDDRLKDPDVTMPDHIHVRVLDEEPYEYMAFHAVNAEDMPLFGKDHLMTEVLLEQLLDGVRVRYLETLSRVTIGCFFALLFLNPARDAMRSLKAQIEGTQNPSVMYEMLESFDPEIQGAFGMNRAVQVAALTAMLLLTVAASGLVWFILQQPIG